LAALIIDGDANVATPKAVDDFRNLRRETKPLKGSSINMTPLFIGFLAAQLKMQHLPTLLLSFFGT
jgi:hypothetical protein